MIPHVMLDLETLSTAPNAAIVSIGAVAFDPAGDELGDTFYQVIDLKTVKYFGLDICPDTVLWWLRQPEEARQAIAGVDVERAGLYRALHEFRTFLAGLGNTDDLILWSAGTSFDCTILREAYKAAKENAPWRYFNERDYRTVRKLAPHVELPRTGVHHNALDDAIHQARHLQLLWRELGLATSSADPAPIATESVTPTQETIDA